MWSVADVDEIKEAYKSILQSFADSKGITYAYAIWLGESNLGLKAKDVRKLLIKLYYEGFWEWDKKMRIKLRRQYV